MWKVKRMNTAPIVVLTLAVGAGGIAASRAGGSDDKPLPAASNGFVADPSAVEARSDGRAAKRGGSIDLAGCGIRSPTAT
jgi:pilus assembly protein CpaB